jgi:hypothetical protein
MTNIENDISPNKVGGEITVPIVPKSQKSPKKSVNSPF